VGVDPDKELARYVLHLVGQGRAFVDQLEFGLSGLRSEGDERSERLIEALELTLRKPPRPGTLRYVVEAASALLVSLREEQAG